MSVEIYQRFAQVLKHTSYSGRLMPYDWGQLPNPLDFTWAAYSMMFDEFARELANTINALTRHTHYLAAWRDLWPSLDEEAQIDAMVVFIDPLATLALNLPYVIRSRFIFSSAHLCHQANRARLSANWKDDFPLDKDVVKPTAATHGAAWRSFEEFMCRLNGVAGQEYGHGTRDFRHAYNHRISPRIVIGISNLVTRTQHKTGGVTYGFGDTPALGLPLVVALLEAQCQQAYLTFEAFQELVREHEAAIVEHISAPR